MSAPSIAGPAGVMTELRKLKYRTRNQVRGILSVGARESVKLINLLREKKSAKEILQIERVLRAQSVSSGDLIPDIFPVKIQTRENYHRLALLPLNKQVELLEQLVVEHDLQLCEFMARACLVNSGIISGNLTYASNILGEAVEAAGYSHYLLRKSALIRVLNTQGSTVIAVDKILDEAGLGSNNIIASSLLRCYQDEQDVLSVKRSIMNYPDRGVSNKFTRDIARVSFHPHAKDQEDLSEMIQSNLQFSLIDALVILKCNRHFIVDEQFPAICGFFDRWDIDGCTIEEIARNYLELDDGESLFYKQSSAWLENKDVVRYRTLQDHFYDVPEATYFELSDELKERISEWVCDIDIEGLVKGVPLTKHYFTNLRILEDNGFVTRSAMFNFLVCRCEGRTTVPENYLFELMGRTRDLPRTINANYLRCLAVNSTSPISQIIYFLLIARKSRNEGDSHQLRRLLQGVVSASYNSDLVRFIVFLSEKSRAVAEYTYDVCTEDFIAKLPRIIKTSAQITETRAALHKWMGEITGEKGYLDRSRNLLIDHQINRVRNELDDNRIYVDVARFSEWFNDELMRELSTVLTSMEHNQTLASADDPQLLGIIEHAYASFCSNRIFGIASYLGRRIRHGTFKGHLYWGVVSIAVASKYKSLFSDPVFLTKWEQWKSNYESKVDDIIKNRLHIESGTKRDGLLKPNLVGVGKFEITMACAKSLAKDFSERKTCINAVQILPEYCWRVAEVDLRNINSFLKGQKSNLIAGEVLNEFKVGLNESRALPELAREFNRELVHLITDKLMIMHGWFKRPLSVSPKASLSLLYKAVVAEVKESFPGFDANTGFEESNDIELVGGPYHVLYDAFYVLVYNAAKHGKPAGKVQRVFGIIPGGQGRCGSVVVKITSEIRDGESEEHVLERLRVDSDDDVENAQLLEGRSGIRKLYQLQSMDGNFSVDNISCENRAVSVCLTYALEHL